MLNIKINFMYKVDIKQLFTRLLILTQLVLYQLFNRHLIIII